MQPVTVHARAQAAGSQTASKYTANSMMRAGPQDEYPSRKLHETYETTLCQ